MRRALAVLVAALLLAGCAIGGERSAHVIDRRLVPRGLLAPTSVSPTKSSGVPTENVTLYLELSQNLVAVDQAVPSPVTLRTVLDVLARGPTATELANGLQSPVSSARPITLESVVNGTAAVNLPSDFTDLGGQDQIVAAAQLVFTATAFPGIHRIALLVGGQPTAVPTANGFLSRGSLSRSDYASLAPR
jgi:spore germination protein GerM